MSLIFETSKRLVHSELGLRNVQLLPDLFVVIARVSFYLPEMFGGKPTTEGTDYRFRLEVSSCKTILSP